jgi:uncharacterized protein
MKKQTVHVGIIIIGIFLLLTVFSGCTVQYDDDNKTPKELPLETKAERMVENLTKEKYASVYENFNDEMKAAFPIKDIQTAWDSLTKSYGTFEEIVKTRKTEEQGYQIIYVTCSFSTLGKLDLRFVFDNESKVAGFQFVQTQSDDKYTSPDYVNTSAFIEENVTIGNNPWQLPATLSVPIGTGPFPAVVLVHGSGPNDRDETIGPNKPFKDLAQGLASQGYAVLRYDKRTMVYPNECAALLNFTPQDEVITDALAAITYLQNNSLVDSENIYLIGHSLGAMMVPEIVNQTTALKGAILMASPARSFEDLYLAQYTYLAELDGSTDENEQEQLDIVAASVERIKSLNISTDEYIFNTPYSYWLYLSTYNPIDVAKNSTIPLFILQGKRDYQVTYEDDFIIWQSTFGDTATMTLKTYDTLNHLFISGTGTPTNTEYMIPGNIDQNVITDIVSWMNSIL